MVALVLRLKLRLLRASLTRDSAWTVIMTVIGWLTAFGVGVFGGIALLGLRTVSDETEAIVLVAGTVTLTLGWIVTAVVLAGADGTLDADLLLPFPLTRRQLSTGVLGAAAIGPGGLLTTLLVAGAVAGVAPAGPGAAVVVLGGVVVVAQCLATTRLLTTWLSRLARTRRGRDAALLVVPVTGFLVNVGVNVLARSLSRTTGPPGWVSAASPIVGWTPPGLAANAMALGGRGEVAVGLVSLVGSVAWFLVLLRVWVAGMDRLLSTSPSSAGGSRAKRSDLFGGVLAFLPRTRLGAVATKELRLQWRDPRQRIGLFGLLAGPIAIVATQGASTRDGLIPVFLATLPATTIATAAANLWGYDGRRYWVQVAGPDDARSDLSGKVLARVITMGTITVALLVVASFLTGRPVLALPGLAFAVLGGGVVLGVAVPFSIIAPVPLPEEAKNLFAGGRGGGSVAQVLPTVLIIGLTTGLLLPLGYLTVRTIDRPLALLAVGLLQVAIGLTAAAIGLRLALRRLRGHEPELLSALTRG